MPQYTTYAELVSYFEGLPTYVTDLNGVTVGNDDAVLNGQNTQMRYPHLWVETPDVNFLGTDANPSTRYRFALVVITGEGQRTPKAGNAALSAMLTILEKVWARLLYDADVNGYFDLVLGQTEGAPVMHWSGDNCHGWRISPVLIDLPRCECDCDPPEEEEPAP